MQPVELHKASRIERSEALGGIEVLHARFTTHRFARHAHDEYVVAVMHAGGESFRCGGRNWLAATDTVTAINPGDAHDGRGAGNDCWVYTAFYPGADLLRSIGAELRGRDLGAPEFRDSVVRDRHLHDVFANAAICLAREGVTLQSETQLYGALGSLVRRHAVCGANRGEPDALHRRAAERAAELLSDCWSEEFALAALAASVGLNRYQLLKAFRRRFGMPPHAYHLNLRIRRAQVLLAQGQPVTAVALEAGFCDQSHFIRRFRGVVGVSPGAYAATQRTSSGSG